MRGVRVSKRDLLLAVVVLALAPWLTGGRDPAGLVLVYLLMLLAAFLVWRLPDPRPLGRSWLSRAGLGLLVWSLGSMIWSVNRFQTIQWVLVLVAAYSAFLAAYQLKALSYRQRWLDGYILVAAAFSLWGWGIYLTGQYDRLTSSFYWANPWAIWVLPAVLLASWQYTNYHRRWYGPVAVVTGSALLLADSRSVFILVGLLALWLMLRLRRRGAFWLRLGSVVLGAVGLSLVVTLVRTTAFHAHTSVAGSRFGDAVKEDSVSRTDRLYYLRSTAAIWRDHLWLGTGAGTFSSVHPQYQYRVISAATNAHNFYAQTTAELGVVGLGLLLALIVGLVAGLRRGVRADRQLRPLAVVGVLLLVHLGLDIDWAYPALVVLVAALAGLVYQPPTQPKQAVYPLWWWLLMLAAGGPALSAYNSYLHDRSARVAQAAGDYESAAREFKSAHLGLTYNPDVLTGEGINYYTLASQTSDRRAGLLNAALARQRALAAIRLDPQNAQHQFLLGRVLRLMGDVFGARQAYQTALKLDQYNSPEYYIDLATLEIANGQVDQGLARLNRLIGLYPGAVVANRHVDPTVQVQLSRAYLVRAGIYLTRGERTVARTDAEAALRLDRTNLPAQQILQSLK